MTYFTPCIKFVKKAHFLKKWRRKEKIKIGGVLYNVTNEILEFLNNNQ